MNPTTERGPDSIKSEDLPESYSIVVIDDHLAFAEALSIAVSLASDLEVIARAPDAESGFDLAMSEQPDLVVCDYRLPGSDTGIDCAARLRAAGFGGAVVVLTGYPAPQVHREAAALAGSPALVLSKDQPVHDLVAAFRDALSGQPQLVAGPQPDTASLSASEFEVLELINQGLGATEIAETLFVSVHTVRSRIKSILRKLECSSQIEALARATSLGILVPAR